MIISGPAVIGSRLTGIVRGPTVIGSRPPGFAGGLTFSRRGPARFFCRLAVIFSLPKVFVSGLEFMVKGLLFSISRLTTIVRGLSFLVSALSEILRPLKIELGALLFSVSPLHEPASRLTITISGLPKIVSALTGFVDALPIPGSPPVLTVRRVFLNAGGRSPGVIRPAGILPAVRSLAFLILGLALFAACAAAPQAAPATAPVGTNIATNASAAPREAVPREEDEYTRYELLDPASSRFRVLYEVTAIEPGATAFFNPIRKGSRASDESVRDLATSQPLPFEVVSGEEARASGLPEADAETSYIRIRRPRPVPAEGGVRLLIEKTYQDEKSYFQEGADRIVFSRPLGIRRNAIVLPPGYELTACNVPAQVLTEPDGRLKVSFMHTGPEAAPLRLAARRIARRID